jgi:DNA-binding transcriptional regulator YiaG
MKDNRIVTPTTEELQALFDLPSGPEYQPGPPAGAQCETLADPEACVRDFLRDLESPQIDTIDTLTGKSLNDCQRKHATAKKQREMLAAALPAAIRALRKKLGVTQWEMVLKLGCDSLSCYARWERGLSVPSGLAILLMLRLCPDAETLANFGLPFSSMR